jgi:hypothetical protein
MQHQSWEGFLKGLVPVQSIPHDGVVDAEEVGADLVLAASCLNAGIVHRRSE